MTLDAFIVLSTLICSQTPDLPHARQDIPWKLFFLPGSLWDVDWGLTRRMNPGIKELHKRDMLLAPSGRWRMHAGDLLDLPAQFMQMLAAEKVESVLDVIREVLDVVPPRWIDVDELWVFTKNQEGQLRLWIFPYVPMDKPREVPGPPSHRGLPVSLFVLPVPDGQPLLFLGVYKPDGKTIDFWLVLKLFRMIDQKQ